jgi:5-formyltetrahydrofolate cyclo-ligase
MTHATVASAKAALRLALRNRRKALLVQHPEADWLAAEAAQASITERFPSPVGKVAALYLAMGSELDPRPLGDWLVAQGWTLALPFVEDDETMSFRRWSPGAPIAHDAAGLRAPSPDAEVLDPDLVICPLLAFDRAGGRLGQGAGWYDRALVGLRAAKTLWVVGLAYSGQEVASVPSEDHDQRLDAIFTEAGLIAVDKDS